MSGMVKPWCPRKMNSSSLSDDNSAFFAAIERLLHEPVARESPGDRGRERFAAEFSQSRMFARCTELVLGRLPGERHRDKKRLYSEAQSEMEERIVLKSRC